MNISLSNFTPRAVRGIPGLLALFLAALGLAGCGGGGSSGAAPEDRLARLELTVRNALGEGISGAVVTVGVGSTVQRATTGAQGTVLFSGLPLGDANVAVEAATYESISTATSLQRGTQSWDLEMAAIGAWAVGIATIRKSEVVEMAANGTSLTFSVDVSMITGESPEPLTTLTDADFRIVTFDCGWGGPRDCASDAAGNATGNSGYYQTDGTARSFEQLPASSRRPYIAGILVERTFPWFGWEHLPWEYLTPALKSYVSALNGDDVVGLSSIQSENGAMTMTVLGPFTADGTSYLDEIDQLAMPMDEYIESVEGRLYEQLLDVIAWTAAAASSEYPGRDATLLLVAGPWLSLEQMYEVTALARASGVRISSLDGAGNAELAIRTGGFSTQLFDVRQYGMAMESADSILSDSSPVYRMQFTLTGAPGTFVPGGNVGMYIHVDTPSTIPNRGAYAYFTVAIPE